MPSIHQRRLLSSKLSASPTAMSHLSHLTNRDRELFQQYGFGPARRVPFSIVHHAFSYQASLNPHNIAVDHPSFSESITYSKLEVQSTRLAHRLRAVGIIPGKRVCLLGRRSIAFVVGILAVLKAGGQYVPLDAVTITDDTLSFVLGDSSPTAVLVMSEYVQRVQTTVPIIDVEQTLAEGENEGTTPLPVEDLSSPADGCYCIYTSGTTGRPKGVDVRHIGVTNVICPGAPGSLSLSSGTRIAHLLNIAFDMGAWEILSSLYNGATLCLRGNSKASWISLLKTVHVVIATPSILAQHDPKEYRGVIRRVIVGGEPCPVALADRWASEGIFFHNCCGPTEISICNTITPPHVPGKALSIGSPIPNTNVYILDSEWSPTASSSPFPKPVPIGAPGTMWVGGVGVSNGYLNLPDKTEERFMDDPFVPGGRMFNTGDLARWSTSNQGQLEHLGRSDDQIKIKGFRVELDGVSASILSHPDVDAAVTLFIPSTPSACVSPLQSPPVSLSPSKTPSTSASAQGELWAFVTPSSLRLDDIREYVKSKQPYYAVPTRWVALEKFEATGNGKVDKRALRTLAQKEIEAELESTKASTVRYPPPVTPAEPSPSPSGTMVQHQSAARQFMVPPPSFALHPPPPLPHSRTISSPPLGISASPLSSATSLSSTTSSIHPSNLLWDDDDGLSPAPVGKVAVELVI